MEPNNNGPLHERIVGCKGPDSVAEASQSFVCGCLFLHQGNPKDSLSLYSIDYSPLK